MSEPSSYVTIALLLVLFFAVATFWRAPDKQTTYRVCETDAECAASTVVNGWHVVPLREPR